MLYLPCANTMEPSCVPHLSLKADPLSFRRCHFSNLIYSSKKKKNTLINVRQTTHMLRMFIYYNFDILNKIIPPLFFSHFEWLYSCLFNVLKEVRLKERYFFTYEEILENSMILLNSILSLFLILLRWSGFYAFYRLVDTW